MYSIEDQLYNLEEEDIIYEKDENGKVVGRIEVPDGIRYISNNCCDRLNKDGIPIEITLPESVMEIADSGFINCKRLKKINIPENVRFISDHLFESCINLEEISIPEELRSIGSAAFLGCTALKKIKLPEGLTTIFWKAFKNCSSLEQIKLPNTALSIGGEVFANCTALQEIEIPENADSIEESCFRGCVNLKKVILNEGIENIYASAFEECIKLEQINIPSSVTRIMDKAFSDCESLKDIVIPKSVKKIGEYAFRGCKSLTQIDIPENINAIRDGVFSECIALKEVNIPDNVSKIGASAFDGCKNLTNINIPEGVTDIYMKAFHDCENLSKIKIPDNIWRIDDEMFSGCKGLREVALPKSLKNINHSAFDGCISLERIDLPDSLQYIGARAFKDCSSLSEILIPQNVVSLHGGVYTNCSSLKKVTIPRYLEGFTGSVFDGCTNLQEICLGDSIIKAAPDVYEFFIKDGILYSHIEGYTVLEKFPAKSNHDEVYRIPKEITAIDSGALVDCDNLKKIILHDNISLIDTDACKYTDISYDDNSKEITLINEKKKKGSKYIPLPYLLHLKETNGLKKFLDTTTYKAFNSNFPDLYKMLKDYPEEEKLDFFKFAVNLGCFRAEKYLDGDMNETEFTIGQKASTLLAKLIKTKELSLGEYHGLFDSLPFDSYVSQDFIDFITPQGKKNDNIELLTRLEKNYPGIFSKVMIGFENAKEYRTTLGDDGMTKIIPWEEAFIKFYQSVRYLGVTDENREIADVYAAKGVNQNFFDMGVKLHQRAKKDNVLEHIIGKRLKESSVVEQIEILKESTESALLDSGELINNLHSKLFTYEWLSKNDPKNGIMGLYVSCCGSISSQYYGRHIAEKSILKNDVQNLVVRNVKGDIISKGTIYVDMDNGYGVINDFELNEKYRADEVGRSGRYSSDDKKESELTDSEKSQARDRNLIYQAFLRGIDDFVKEYNKQHPDKPLKQVNVGMGYNRLKKQVESLEKATKMLKVPESYNFNDALIEQFIIYPRQEHKKETDISNKVQQREDELDGR